MSARVGVVIITHRARHLLPRCIPPLAASPLRPRILVVNSDSRDGTVECARALGAETWVVPRPSFNHGLTREAARRRLGGDIVVMMTPDVRPISPHFLERLIAPVAAGGAAVAYARQLPRPEACALERLGRSFAYPPRSELRSREDYARLGSATHFCSNACAAWSQPALDAVGGFPETLVSEETITAARLLRAGFRIAYVAGAEVVHSHPVSLLADFRRQFDIGWTRARFAPLLLAAGSDEARGFVYLRRLLRGLAREAPAALPYALLHTALRYAGYRLGRLAHNWPPALCALFSGQEYYWAPGARELRASASAEQRCASSF